MKTLIIYNPLAGKKSPKDKQLKNYLKDFGVEHEIVWHNIAQGNFTYFQPNDFARIFVCGGDGTIKEVASWIITHNSQTPLAILPAGSANILAQSLGVPLNLKNALKLGFSDKIQKIDIGLINNRHYFLIAAGCGFDAKVIKNASRKMKKIWGFLAYIVSLIFSFFNAKANKFFIKIDEQSQTATAQSIFISNFAKFFNLTLNPASKINDGYLNVSILKTLNIKDLGILIYKLIAGNYQKDWRYEYHAAKKIYLLPLHKKTQMQIDGEFIELPYMDIKILPQALNVVANKLP